MRMTVFSLQLNSRRQQMKEDLKKLYQYKRDSMVTKMEELRKQSASLTGLIEQCHEAVEVHVTCLSIRAVKTSHLDLDHDF